MKASFVMSNPTMTGADWSFMPKISKETAAEEIEAAQGGTEKGEMTGGEQVVEDVVVIDKPEVHVDRLEPSRPYFPTSNCNYFFYGLGGALIVPSSSSN